MGGANENMTANEHLDKMLPDVANYDLLFFSSQECIGKRLTNRVAALEAYLRDRGFDNIDH